MKRISFEDRRDILEDIQVGLLVNLYGEAGIGKSRALTEFQETLEKRGALVLRIDLEKISASEEDPQRMVLQGLMDGLPHGIDGVWASNELVASLIVAELTRLGENEEAALLFDGTEVFQENMSWWSWLEAALVGPLVVEGRVRQIFAGRVPVPWRRFEVRRAVRHVRLEPLKDDYAQRHARAALLEARPELKTFAKLDRVAALVLDFSFGHPRLTEEIAGYLASRLPEVDFESEQLAYEVCSEKVKPLINDYFFSRVDDDWKDILWAVSVLHWFDAAFLMEYLQFAFGDRFSEKSESYFIQGIARLRLQNTVLWRERSGDQLHGVIGQVTAHCLEVVDRQRFRELHSAAAQTLTKIIESYTVQDSPEVDELKTEIEYHHKLAGG